MQYIVLQSKLDLACYIDALSCVAVTGRFSICLTLQMLGSGSSFASLLTSNGNLDKPSTFSCNCVGINAIMWSYAAQWHLSYYVVSPYWGPVA